MIGHHRFGSEESALLHVSVHPRPAPLGRTRVVITEKKSEWLTVGVIHFPYPHIGLIYGKIVPLLESQAVKFPRGKKYAVSQDMIQLVVWSHVRLIELIARFAHFLGREIPVPGVDLQAAFFLIDNLLHGGCLAAGVGHRRHR